MTRAAGVAACILATALAAPACAQTAGSPFRYDDDVTTHAGDNSLYGRLKYVPLSNASYASLGADLRERVETDDRTALGLRSARGDIYDLHRFLLDLDLHVGSVVRTFVQLGNYDEVGRNGGPISLDRDRLDVAQAFVDVRSPLGAGRFQLRLGRAEMSFDDGALIGLRDGPNVRQSWDGLRATYSVGKLQLDAFSVRPVTVRMGVFDNAGSRGEGLQGVHLTTPVAGPIAFDGFIYWSSNPHVLVLGVNGRERTQTGGIRLRAASNTWSGSLGAIFQRGETDSRRVRAFALHGDVGATLASAPSAPHLMVRADVLSGGDPNGRNIGTFNALYPNVAYSTEATIEAPANLVQVGTVAGVSLGKTVTLQYTLEGLWRYTSRDAFYAAPLMPLIRPDGDRDRYSGLEQQLRLIWRANDVVTVTTALVRFSAGNAIRRAHGHDESFAMTSVALRL